MAKIEGLTKVIAVLQKKAAQAQTDNNASVVVGFSTAYAVYVHENIEMKWRGLPRKAPAKGDYWGPHGQAKYLENPARELSNNGTLGAIVMTALKAKKTMAQALLLAGLRLQRESQALVPVDTGTLKNSAFTTLERGTVPTVSKTNEGGSE